MHTVLPKFHTFPVLLPLSWIYSGVMQLRNWAFDSGKLRVTSFENRVAVIGVGNICAGGAGKTPHIEYLIRLLQGEGIGPIAVLSRGYRRETKGFLLATPGITSSKLGDESFQLFRKFPDIIIAVDEDRVHGINRLLKLPEPPKVILLDDCFQHRYVKPGLNICLTSYRRIVYQDHVLPAGLLREDESGMDRTDIVIVTKCPKSLRDEEENDLHARMPITKGQPIFYSAYRYTSLYSLVTNQPVEVDPRREVLIVSGVADPAVMVDYVERHYRLLDHLSFGDHHRFSYQDLREMQKRLDNVNHDGYCTNNSGEKPIIITTEKDAARLLDMKSINPELKERIYYLPTEVFFLGDHAKLFNQKVLDYVRKDRTNG